MENKKEILQRRLQKDGLIRSEAGAGGISGALGPKCSTASHLKTNPG